MRRCNTGWRDGDYDLVAGHIDGGEHLTTALLREAREEIGITFEPNRAVFAHLMHYLGDKEYLNVAFEVTEWQGEPAIMEPDKCDDLQWFPLSDLPANLTPATKAILGSRDKICRSYTEIAA